MSVDYYLVNDETHHAVRIADRNCNPFNRGALRAWLLRSYLPFEAPAIRFVAEWDLPAGYLVCGGEINGARCSREAGECPADCEGR